MVCFYVRDQNILYLQTTMEIGDQRGRGAASLEPRVDWGRNKKGLGLQRAVEIATINAV